MTRGWYAQNVRALHPLLTGLQTVVELHEGWNLRARQVRWWPGGAISPLQIRIFVALASIHSVLPTI